MKVKDNVREMFRSKGKTPAEEAAVFGSLSNVAATATTTFAERSVQRLAYGIRWLKALQDVAAYAEQAFGQVAEEALLDTTPGGGTTTHTVLSNLGTLYEEPARSDFPADFATGSAGETEKIADTEPKSPMSQKDPAHPVHQKTKVDD